MSLVGQCCFVLQRPCPREREWHDLTESKETAMESCLTMPLRITPQERKIELLKQGLGLRGAGTEEQKSSPRQDHCASQRLMFWKGRRGKSQEPQITRKKKSHHSPRALPLGVGI